MRISRRDFVKSATASGIALSITPLAIAAEPSFAARETLPGRQGWNPAATGAGRIDGVAKVTGAKLYASDFRAVDLPGWPAKTSHAMFLRAADATHVLRRPRPFAPERCVEAFRGGDRRRPRANRDARSRILCRRPHVPGGQDAALSGSAGGAVDLRGFRRLRPGAARVSRRSGPEVRRGNRPGQNAQLRPVSFHAHWWPDSRRTRCLLDGQEWPGQPGILRQLGTPDLGTTCRRASLRRSRDLWGRDPRGARSQQSSALGAGPGIRDAVGRPHGSRAGKRPCLV